MNLSFFGSAPRVAAVRLSGLIAARGGLGGGAALNIASVEPALYRAFTMKRIAAVFLLLNSPGGSPVQSSLIAARIRQLAAQHKRPVIACVEDAAASGGYWLACAADEIVVDPTSIVGSIGVISAGFGFQGALEKLGVERRLRTAGTEKSFLDPFRPEQPADAERLETLLAELHAEFRAWVAERRAGKLRLPEDQVFTGRFWTGRRAVEHGLADRLGDLHGEVARRYGEKARIVMVGGRRKPLLARLLPGLSAEALLLAAEERAAWGRLGL